ncbi:MAG: RNA-binding S4 domain-containing protein [Rhodoferax sp.]
MKNSPQAADGASRVRIDKWLWAARFFKTRSLAAEAIDKGRVRINGQVAKASRDVKVGDFIALLHAPCLRELRVLGVSHQRGPAPVAAQLYQETDESIARRQRLAEQRRLAPEPAWTLTQGRPTKRDRRQTDALRHHAAPQWDARWSASLDEFETRG